MVNKSKHRDNPAAVAAFSMICASLGFAIMGAFIKSLSRLPAWEVTFFRALVNLVALLPWAFTHTKLVATWRKEPVALLVRGIAGGTSAVLYFYAIGHMKLADAVMIGQTAPIMVLILSALFLNEPLNLVSVTCVLVSFTGLGFILKPDFHFTNSAESLAGLAGVAGAMVAGVAYVSIKIATRSIPTRLIVLTFATIATLISLIPTLIYFISPTPLEWAWLLAAGLFATAAQELMTKGYAGLPASVASPIMLATVAFSTIIGWLCWSEIPDRWSFFGMFLIASGLVGAFRFKSRVSLSP